MTEVLSVLGFVMLVLIHSELRRIYNKINTISDLQLREVVRRLEDSKRS